MTSSTFDATLFRELARTRGLSLGSPLHTMATTASTNDDAMEGARNGAAHGATFVADAQTRGRGRRGATWTSPPGQNLLFSVVLRPKLDVARVGTLTLAVGLAVRHVVASRVTVPVLVKWPNDVMAAERKVAGILLESQLTGAAVSAVVVGVGLNVGMRELPPDIEGIATSLALLGCTELSRERLLVDLLVELEARLRAHEREGLAAGLDELRSHDALFGRRVRVDGVEGVARGIDDRGALQLDDDEGTRHAISSGQLTVL